MSLTINTNIQSMVAQRALSKNAENQKKSFEEIATGLRINKAADDVAGLAISEKLKAEIRSLRQAGRNANDGVSLIQVAEGGMNEINNMLIRMRELSIQAASDTVGPSERGFMDKEIQALKLEVNRIAMGTEYGGHKLLDGSSDILEFQIGTKNDPIIDRLFYDSSSLPVSLEALEIENVTTASKEEAQSNLKKLDAAIEYINGNRSVLGALQNRMNSTISNVETYKDNLQNANSRIRDTDIAEASSNLIKENILAQSNTAILAQANQTPQLALKLIS